VFFNIYGSEDGQYDPVQGISNKHLSVSGKSQGTEDADETEIGHNHPPNLYGEQIQEVPDEPEEPIEIPNDANCEAPAARAI